MHETKAQETLDQTDPILIELPLRGEEEIALPQLKRAIWTENKAQLIRRYLFLFGLVTRHGTYIDGFAGPNSQISQRCGLPSWYWKCDQLS